jgi:DNA-binding protein Fis
MKPPVAAADPVCETERALKELLAQLVGRYDFPGVIAFVRDALVERALVVTHGNKTNAARLLGVTRQAIQQQAHKRPSLLGGAGRDAIEHRAGAAIDHRRACRDAQLGKDAPQMRANRPLTDLQPVGDLLVQQAIGYEAGDL